MLSQICLSRKETHEGHDDAAKTLESIMHQSDVHQAVKRQVLNRGRLIRIEHFFPMDVKCHHPIQGMKESS